MLETVRWITADGKILSGPAADAGEGRGRLRIIDQTRLPEELVYLELDEVEAIFEAILRLSVRGAPAIGCAAALGLAACAQHIEAANSVGFTARVQGVAARLGASRPTAVNLFWALDRCCQVLNGVDPIPVLKVALLQEALRILEEDIQMCHAIGGHGASLIEEGMGVLTHCNAGALATGDYGTALAPIYRAHEAGIRFTVFSDETRPLLQGSRLTAWELNRAGVEVVTICDNMAAQVMKEGKIGLVLVGSDRIAANGDAANKIGTYGLAVLARHHGIPFYVAAPSSTIDASLAHGSLIPIEQRGADEVRHFGERLTAPAGVEVYNPAFDVTPNALITGIITEAGLHRPPYDFA
jgi:methylthioribose-1-phosphate isomerase